MIAGPDAVASPVAGSALRLSAHNTKSSRSEISMQRETTGARAIATQDYDVIRRLFITIFNVLVVTSVCCTIDLVRFELVHVLYLTKRPPHLLDDLHVFERNVEGNGGGAHRIHDYLTCTLGRYPCFLAGGARRLGGFAELLALLADCLERLTMVIADFTRLLGQASRLFRVIHHRPFRTAMYFRRSPILLALATASVGIRVPQFVLPLRVRCEFQRS